MLLMLLLLLLLLLKQVYIAPMLVQQYMSKDLLCSFIHYSNLQCRLVQLTFFSCSARVLVLHTLCTACAVVQSDLKRSISTCVKQR
jgi:hypothetical protein